MTEDRNIELTKKLAETAGRLRQDQTWSDVDADAPRSSSAGPAFLLIFVLLVVGIVVVGWFYYRKSAQYFRAEVERQLAAVADLKVGELTQWREDRQGDGAIFFKNPSFAALVRRFFSQSADADAQRQLQDWLDKYPTMEDYDEVRLMDNQSVTRFSVPGDLGPASANTVRAASEALRMGRITIEDFYRHEHNQRIYLSVQIPLFDELNANRPLGVLVFRIDPAKYLYPFIRHWPTPSVTAETLLLRRDGNDVLFLNELRFQTNSALNLHEPLDGVACPEVQAAIGREGLMEGMDYRGVPVVVAMRSVPNSPWTMVARIDAIEVYAPLRTQFWQVIVLIGVLLFGAGAAVWLVWWQQRVSFLVKQVAMAESLRESELQLRLLFNSGRDAVAVHFMGTDGKPTHFTKVNDTACERLGYSREEMLELSPQDIDAPDRAGQMPAIIEKLVKTGQVLFEIEHVAKDGHRIPVEVSACLLQLGDKPAVLSVARDITERKKVESEKARLLAIIEESQDFIGFSDLEGNIAYLNRAARTMYGLPDSGDLSHLKIWDMHPDWAAKLVIEQGIPMTLRDGSWRSEDALLHRNGSEIPISEILVVHKDSSGKPLFLSTIMRDISERKKAEEALQLTTKELKAKSAEIEHFLYAASHDLKTPVISIKSFMKHLKDDLAAGDTNRIERDLKFINMSADKMGNLLDDLLEMSRVGRRIQPPSYVTAKAMADEAVNIAAGRISDRGVAVKIAEIDVGLYGDRQRLAEIWQNLIENACKFMGDQKNPRIDIGMEQRDKEAVFYVKDNGIGIDPKHHDRVFDLFEKLDKNAEGTGMGLAIVKRIVELYQGRIWVESAGAGQGTCFCFTLPGAIKIDGKA